MNRFLKVFKHKNFNIIGMIHVGALPGTPNYSGNWPEIVERAKHEAYIYAKLNIDAIMLENMHDVPYVQSRHLNPETVSCMTRLSTEVRRIMPKKTSCGLQILASGNKQALAVALASGLQFIRVEGFVFGHVADEGYTDACAGQLMRYRKQIDAEKILVFTDLKKKHSSHAITEDVSLLQTAKAAEFFLTDGVIITGNSTGHAANPKDLIDMIGEINVPILIGSGVTIHNLEDYFPKANAAIIGSHFKLNGEWNNSLCEKSISMLMDKVVELRECSHSKL